MMALDEDDDHICDLLLKMRSLMANDDDHFSCDLSSKSASFFNSDSVETISGLRGNVEAAVSPAPVPCPSSKKAPRPAAGLGALGALGASQNNSSTINTNQYRQQQQQQQHQYQQQPMICDFCASSDVNLEDGNYVCKGCFSIVARFIDSSPEWRYYGPDDHRSSDPTRCGPPANDLLPCMGSMLRSTGKDSQAMRIVQRYQFWNSMSYKERTLYTVFDQLSNNAATNGIPACIIEEAKVLYKRMIEMRVSRGENRQALIAASVYISCKTNQVPRSVKEIATMFNVRVPAMTKGCKLFQQLMTRLPVKSSAPEDFVGRFCSKLALDSSAARLCRYIVQKADELCIVGESTPPSIVAGCLQLVNTVLQLNIPKAQLADACHISQVTITKCYKRMQDHRSLLLPEDLAAFLLT